MRTPAWEMGSSTPIVHRTARRPFRLRPPQPVPTLGGGLCCLTLGSYFPSGAQDQSAAGNARRRSGLHERAADQGSHRRRTGQGEILGDIVGAGHRFHREVRGRSPGRFCAEPARSCDSRPLSEGLQIGSLTDSAGCALRVRDRSRVYRRAPQSRTSHSGRPLVFEFPALCTEPEHGKGSPTTRT